MSESPVFTLNIRSGITRATVREKYRGAQGFLDRLRRLSEDPQHALPDIFIWMISGGRRVAYHRMKARSLLYRWECLRSALKDNLTICSSIPEEAGSDCGIVQNILLKVLHTPHSTLTSSHGHTVGFEFLSVSSKFPRYHPVFYSTTRKAFNVFK